MPSTYYFFARSAVPMYPAFGAGPLGTGVALAVLHELWVHDDGQTFVLAGPTGDDARALLPKDAVLAWTVEANSHFEAMSRYYEHMGWGEYTTEFPEVDMQTYAERGWE